MRLRIRFTKLGKVRFTGHRDVARIWERALRRAVLPVALTEGFSPRPRLSFGLALSTGHESLSEYLDVELAVGADVGLDLDALPARLAACLPAGMDVTALAPLATPVASLQADVSSCTWVIGVDGGPPAPVTGAAQAAVAAVMSAPAVIVTTDRKGGPVTLDIRPGVAELAVLERWPVAVADDADPGAVVVEARLATQPQAVRPTDLAGALWPGAQARRVLRRHQWIEHDGARREPLEAPAATSPTRTARCA